MEKRTARAEVDPLLPADGDAIVAPEAGDDAELVDAELIDDSQLIDFAPSGALLDTSSGDADAIREELEARLAEARGEMGARIAELEGELEALREERSEWTRELDELESELVQRATLLAETRSSAEQLREALTSLDEERMTLASRIAHLQHERERIQDDLAARIAELAGELANRDQEILRLKRELTEIRSATKGSGDQAELVRLRAELAELRSTQTSSESGAELDRLRAELDDLQGENEFLHSELDRYAAQAIERNRTE